jgi:hypothetical protein
MLSTPKPRSATPLAARAAAMATRLSITFQPTVRYSRRRPRRTRRGHHGPSRRRRDCGQPSGRAAHVRARPSPPHPQPGSQRRGGSEDGRAGRHATFPQLADVNALWAERGAGLRPGRSPVTLLRRREARRAARWRG